MNSFIKFFASLLFVSNIYAEISTLTPYVGRDKYPGVCFYTSGDINFILETGVREVSWRDATNFKIIKTSSIVQLPYTKNTTGTNLIELTVYPMESKLVPIVYYLYHTQKDGACFGLGVKNNTNMVVGNSIKSAGRSIGWSNVVISGGGLNTKPSTNNAKVVINIRLNHNIARINNYKNMADLMLQQSYNQTGIFYMPWASSSRALLNMMYIKYLNQDISRYKNIYANLGGGTDDMLWALSAGAIYKNIRLNNNANCRFLNCDLLNKRDVRDIIYFAGNDNNVFITNLNGIRPQDNGYLNLPLMKSLYSYLSNSANFISPSIISDNWYGLPWKDHAKYNYYFKGCNSCWSPVILDGFYYRNSITNSLFWLYSVELLQPNILSNESSTKQLLLSNIDKEYKFFFGQSDRFTWQYQTLINQNGVSDGYKFNTNGAISYIDGATLSYNTGILTMSLAETYLLNPSKDNADKYIGAGIFVLDRATNYFQKDGRIIEPLLVQYGGSWPINNDRKLFQGIYATSLGVFGLALNDAINKNYNITYNNKTYTVSELQEIHKNLKSLVQNTANYIWSYYGYKPTIAHLSPVDSNYLNNLDYDYITMISASGVFIGAALFDR